MCEWVQVSVRFLKYIVQKVPLAYQGLRQVSTGTRGPYYLLGNLVIIALRFGSIPYVFLMYSVRARQFDSEPTLIGAHEKFKKIPKFFSAGGFGPAESMPFHGT